MFDADGGKPAKADGSDIRFTSDAAGLNELAVDLNNFSTNNDESLALAEIYVSLGASLSSSTDTTIYVWWGNSAAALPAPTATYGRNIVWTPLWKGVYHMDGSGNLTSSTGTNDGTNSGTTSTAGRLAGYARHFVAASTQYIQIAGLFGSVTNALSMMAWVNLTLTDQREIVSIGDCVMMRNTSSGFYGAYHYSTDYRTFSYGGNLANMGWVLVGFDVYPGGSTQKLYYNDTMPQSGTYTDAINYSGLGANSFIGKHGNGGTNYFNGDIDEVRIGPALEMPHDYMITTYRAQTSPQTFILVGIVIDNQFPTAWKWKASLTQDHTKNTGDVANLVCPFVWTGSAATSNLPSLMMDADGVYAALNGGADLRFTSDEAGTIELPFQIVNFVTNNDPASALAEIWVKVPNVYSATDAIIYVWWGNVNAQAYAATDTYGQYNAWPSSYKADWHLQDTPTTYADATVNVNNGTNSSNVTSATGKIAKGESWKDTAGSIAWINVNNAASLNITSQITVAAWVNPDTFADGDGRILQKGGSDNQYRLQINNNNTTGKIYWECKGLSTHNNLTSGGAPAIGSWTRILATYGPTYGGGQLRIYINGTVDNSATATGSISTSTDVLNLGHKPSSAVSGDSLNGKMDEISIQNAEVNEAWAKADYNSQNSPQTYWSVGAIITGGSWFLLNNKNSLYNTMQLTNGMR